MRRKGIYSDGSEMTADMKMEKLFSMPPVRVITAVFCTLLWGTAYPLIKLGYREMNISSVPDVLVFAGVRYLIAGFLIIASLLIFSRKNLVIKKEKILWVFLFGMVQTGLMYLLNYIGIRNTTATKTSVLTASSAFFAVLLAPLFFKKEKITAPKVIGCFVGMTGILIVNMSFFSGSMSFTGEGLIFIAMILNTLGGFIGKVAGEGNPFGATGYQLSIGGVFLTLCGLLFGGCVKFTFKGFMITFFLAVVSSLAFALWTVLLVYNEAGRVLVFNLLCPVFGAFFSFVILGERDIFSPVYIVSIILVCIGIFLVNYDFKGKSRC